MEMRGHSAGSADAAASPSMQTGGMATFGNLETEVEPLAALMREHDEIHGLVTAAQEQVEAAIAETGNPELAFGAARSVRELDRYMAENLVIHIAKEEDALFPALRGFTPYIDQVVDEMVEQHHEVRYRQEMITRALAALEHTHDEIDAARAGLAGRLPAEGVAPGPQELDGLLDALRRLDWILQGHFGDEEDDLFVPALELLDRDAFARMAEHCTRIEAGTA
jgi:hypothetical protein